MFYALKETALFPLSQTGTFYTVFVVVAAVVFK